MISNLTWIADETIKQESMLLHPELWPDVSELLEQTRQQALQRGIQLHYYGPQLGPPHLICKENVLRACFVSWCGDVSPCVFSNLSISKQQTVEHYFDGKMHKIDSLIFGNVREQTLMDIWQSDTAKVFRAAFEKRLARAKQDSKYLPAPCQYCYKLLEQ